MARKRKRRFRKKRNGPKTLILRGPTAVPDQMLVKMKYVQLFTLSSAGGNTAHQVFRGNSIFDPDFTGVGGQPMSRDQWQDFYQRYTVTGSSIKVEYNLQASADGIGSIMGIVPVDTSGAVTGIGQAIELPYSKHISVPNNQSVPLVLKNYITTKKKFGYKNILQEDDLSATFGANPVEQYFWNVYMITADALSSSTANCVATITYYVRMFDRKDLSRS